MGQRVQDEYDLGAVFIAIEPWNVTEALEKPVGTDVLLDEIRSLKPLSGTDHVSAPGDNSAQKVADALTDGTITIDSSTLEILRNMAAGGAGLTADKLTN
jgi:LDH2 family malate/lactate/ureidoglycolate dehydrogenase